DWSSDVCSSDLATSPSFAWSFLFGHASLHPAAVSHAPRRQNERGFYLLFGCGGGASRYRCAVYDSDEQPSSHGDIRPTWQLPGIFRVLSQALCQESKRAARTLGKLLVKRADQCGEPGKWRRCS